MKLLIGKNESTGAVLPVRWCLTSEEVKKIAPRKNVHVLFLVVNKGKEVDRYLVPVEQMMYYVEFTKPGKNILFATLVYQKDLRELKKTVFKRNEDGKYIRDMYDEEKGRFFRQYKSFDDLLDLYETQVVIDVSPDFFAEQPSSLEWRWVNLWFETKPRNQCQFRRRRMLAYSIQPLIILLFVVIATIVRLFAALIWSLVMRRYGVNWGAIVHPFKNDTEDVWHEAKDEKSFITHEKNGEKRSEVMKAVMFLTFYFVYPPVTAIGVIVAIVGKTIFHSSWSWWMLFFAAPLIILVAAIIITLLIFGVIWLLEKLAIGDTFSEWKEKMSAAGYQKERQKREFEETRRFADLQILACPNESLVPKLGALPPEKQTIYLRFLDLKSRVCKPFAR